MFRVPEDKYFCSWRSRGQGLWPGPTLTGPLPLAPGPPTLGLCPHLHRVWWCWRRGPQSNPGVGKDPSVTSRKICVVGSLGGMAQEVPRIFLEKHEQSCLPLTSSPWPQDSGPGPILAGPPWNSTEASGKSSPPIPGVGSAPRAICLGRGWLTAAARFLRGMLSWFRCLAFTSLLPRAVGIFGFWAVTAWRAGGVHPRTPLLPKNSVQETSVTGSPHPQHLFCFLKQLARRCPPKVRMSCQGALSLGGTHGPQRGATGDPPGPHRVVAGLCWPTWSLTREHRGDFHLLGRMHVVWVCHPVPSQGHMTLGIGGVWA